MRPEDHAAGAESGVTSDTSAPTPPSIDPKPVIPPTGAATDGVTVGTTNMIGADESMGAALVAGAFLDPDAVRLPDGVTFPKTLPPLNSDSDKHVEALEAAADKLTPGEVVRVQAALSLGDVLEHNGPRSVPKPTEQILLKADSVNLRITADKEGKLRLQASSWDDARVILAGEKLEVRWDAGQAVLVRMTPAKV